MHLLKATLAVVLLATLFAVMLQPSIAAPQQSSAAASAEAKATVYVYRYKQFVGGGLEPSVYCDEAQVARMDNGRYFAIKLDPGTHVLRSNDKQSGLELDLRAGQEVFIRVEIATGFAKGHGRLVQMTPEQGRYELQSKKLKPLGDDKVVDKTRVSIEEVKFDKSKTSEAAK